MNKYIFSNIIFLVLFATYISVAGADTGIPSYLTAFADCDPSSSSIGQSPSPTRNCGANGVNSDSILTYTTLKLRSVSNETAISGDYFAAGTIWDNVVVSPLDLSLVGQTGKLFLAFTLDGILSKGAELSFGVSNVINQSNGSRLSQGRPLKTYLNLYDTNGKIQGSTDTSSFWNATSDTLVLSGVSVAEFDITFGQTLTYDISMVVHQYGQNQLADFSNAAKFSNILVTDSSLKKVDVTLSTVSNTDLNPFLLTPTPAIGNQTDASGSSNGTSTPSINTTVPVTTDTSTDTVTTPVIVTDTTGKGGKAGKGGTDTPCTSTKPEIDGIDIFPEEDFGVDEDTNQWLVHAGQTFTVNLTAIDCLGRAATIQAIGRPNKSSFTQSFDSSLGKQKSVYTWTPALADVEKPTTVKFKALVKTKQGVKSSAIQQVKALVLPPILSSTPDPISDAAASKVLITKAAWYRKGNHLEIQGLIKWKIGIKRNTRAVAIAKPVQVLDANNNQMAEIQANLAGQWKVVISLAQDAPIPDNVQAVFRGVNSTSKIVVNGK